MNDVYNYVDDTTFYVYNLDIESLVCRLFMRPLLQNGVNESI